MLFLFAVAAALWLVMCRWVTDALWGLPPAELWLFERPDGHRSPGAAPYAREG